MSTNAFAALRQRDFTLLIIAGPLLLTTAVLVSLPADQGPALEAEFEAKKLFLRRIGRVEEGSGVLVA